MNVDTLNVKKANSRLKNTFLTYFLIKLVSERENDQFMKVQPRSTYSKVNQFVIVFKCCCC